MLTDSVRDFQLRLVFTYLLSFNCVGFAVPRLEDSLNVVLRSADDNAGEGLSKSDCQELLKLSEEENRFKSLAAILASKRCVGAAEDSKKSDTNPASKKEDQKIWDGKSMCKKNSSRVLECDHNPLTGRGLIVLSGSDSVTNTPSLVCAHFAVTSRSPIDYYQEIGSRCVLTEYDWRYEGARSDARGMLAWVHSPVGHARLKIPSTLIEQCRSLFTDAYYCSPTFLLIPDENDERINVCSLKTRDYTFGLGPIFQVSSSNSEWKCQSKSLREVDQDQRLTVEERSCVPDELGRLMNDYCRLPYMPVAREPLRTYIP